MTIDDARIRHRRVAVGPTREAAAAAFGRTSDDLFVTSYADLDGEVDLDQVTQLDLVASADGHRSIAAACARLHTGGPAVRVAVLPSTAAECAGVLERADVDVLDLEAVDGVVLLRLGPGTDGRSTVGLVLRALAAGDSTSGNRPTEPAASREVARPARRRPVPQSVQLLTRAERWRHGRRRWAAVGAVAAVVVVLLLIGLLPASAQVLTSIGVPLLVVLVVLAAASSTYVTLLLARQAHRQSGRLERMVLRNREVVHSRTQALARRLDRIEEAQARMPFLEQYVEAVAEHNAASNARLRDLLETLDIEPAPGRVVDDRRLEP